MNVDFAQQLGCFTFAGDGWTT